MSGSRPGVPDPNYTKVYQQLVDTGHAKPHHVSQTSQPVAGKVPRSGRWLEGRDGRDRGKDEESDRGPVQHQSCSTAGQHHGCTQVSREIQILDKTITTVIICLYNKK